MSVTMAQPPEWVADALCAQVDPKIFFPEKGESSKDAKRICARCDVKAECLAYALDNAEPFGIWGGLSAIQRRILRRKLPVLKPIDHGIPGDASYRRRQNPGRAA